ncbi:MAG: efflux RND transporter periplasmic adaptor subunit [Anaerolineales bacterium]|jgi:HlyD family secretion protein|nr:efflux RND transporter periplasmic adaptor subunit [Anaerolineales bacterium]
MQKLFKHRWSLPLLFVVISALFVGGYFFSANPQTASATEAPLQTAKVRTGDISITINGSGNLVAAARVELGFRTGGTVINVPAQVGDSVSAGDELVILDDSAARLTLAEKELALQTLISPDALANAEIARINAQASLDKAIAELQYLISPWAYNEEVRLLEAQSALDEKKSSNAPVEEITAAEDAVTRAQNNLNSARSAYFNEYAPANFSLTYRDAATNEVVKTINLPTEDAVNLARAKVRSAQLALEDARVYYTRLSGDADPCADLTSYGTLTSKLTSACLAVQSAQYTLDNTHLTAPTAGVVTSVNASVGQSVGTSPVVAIASDELFIHFYVEETDLALVQAGLPVRVIFDAYPEQTFEGVITRVDPELAVVSSTPYVSVWAEVNLPAGQNFLNGMTAEIEVVAGEAQSALLIPVQALRELAPGSYAVFILQADGTLKLTPVKIGLRDFANVQILEGVQKGDVVSTGVVETE